MAKRKEYIISNARLMQEWDWEENNKLGFDPSKLTTGSGMKPSWICPKGHKYKKQIYGRASGEECSACTKARGTSFREQCFFYYIKKYYPDAINRYKEIFNNE